MIYLCVVGDFLNFFVDFEEFSGVLLPQAPTLTLFIPTSCKTVPCSNYINTTTFSIADTLVALDSAVHSLPVSENLRT
jgi:hypothetical protein